MTKQIDTYTVDELSEKIKAIKAEREKTEKALKKYEEELERRKHKVPLGVPFNGSLTGIPLNAFERNFILWFESAESADRFDEYLKDYIKALHDIVRGKPIDIKVLAPLLRKGWVACFEDGAWAWFKNKPELFGKSPMTYWCAGWDWYKIKDFNIKPAEDWRNSLMECGL